ncbi:MAG TPA: hypothetical protein VE801_11010 [Xanthobacteraceae bacterium]|jgi:hypothetical protein|nr:hypothetical protein [Xanthobacteraceae bacterium]
MLDVEACHGLVHLAGEMLRGADAGGGTHIYSERSMLRLSLFTQ